MQKNEDAEQAGITVAEKWLTLVDAGNVAESWNQTSQLFKSAVSQEQWKVSLASAQVPLGKTISRKLRSKHYAEELPGAPDGEYVVIEYESTFEKKKNGTETITPMRDVNGEWRVAGYFVR